MLNAMSLFAGAQLSCPPWAASSAAPVGPPSGAAVGRARLLVRVSAPVSGRRRLRLQVSYRNPHLVRGHFICSYVCRIHKYVFKKADPSIL